jgi:hypothetical protein
MPEQRGTHPVHQSPAALESQPPDPADIAAAVLKTVRECSQALTDFSDYQEVLIGQMREQLNRLEVTALRSMVVKVGRS